HVRGSSSVHAQVSLAYPFDATPPPAQLVDGAIPRPVQEMLLQWSLYRAGAAGMLDRAYFCLSHLETAYGSPPQRTLKKGDIPHYCTKPPSAKRQTAAATLHISISVLCRLGELTASEDPRYWRKSGGGGPPVLS